MSNIAGPYQVLAPTVEPTPAAKSAAGKASLAPAIADFNGKTICAMRHTFRADESFAMIEALFKERYRNIKFIPNSEMPDFRIGSSAEAQQLEQVLRDKGCDVLLVGNAA